jgi:hypothetical protein
LMLLLCMAAILVIGIYPQPLLKIASRATQPLIALQPDGTTVVQR